MEYPLSLPRAIEVESIDVDFDSFLYYSNKSNAGGEQ